MNSLVADSKRSQEIDLYSDYTKNKLQVLTLPAITFLCVGLQIEVWLKICTVEPQLSGPHLPGFSVNRATEMTALLE